MSSINIKHNHKLDHKDACKKAEVLLEKLADKYGLTVESDGEGTISFSGSGISGNVQICENEINFDATLGFLMSAMKPVISSEVTKKLEECFS